MIYFFQLQDVSDTRTYDREETNNFFGNHNAKTEASGFVVKGGPWEQKAPDTTSTEDFPTFGGGAGPSPQASVPWGPRR